MEIFKKWVPNWLAKIILFALLVPNMVMFFLPLANEEVSAGYYGIEPNDVQFMVSLYYAGFASFYCLERRFYSYFTSKQYFIQFQLFQLLCCYVLFSSNILIGIGYLSVYGQQYYWFTDEGIIKICLMTGLAILLFIIRQSTLKRPYIDFSTLKTKNYLWGALLLFFMYIERFSFTNIGSFYKSIFHMDPQHISYMYCFNLIGIICGVALAAWHQIKKSNIIWLWICGFTSLLIYHILMTQMLDNTGNETYYSFPLFAHGLGLGLIMVPTILFMISVVPYYLIPSAAAFGLLVRFLGYSVSTILTKFFTVYNYNQHYANWLDYISNNNQFYQDKKLQISLYLHNNGFNHKDIPSVSDKILKTQLDNQILLRSIMDYYTLMIWLSLVILFFLLCYYIKEKKFYVHFRPFLPI